MNERINESVNLSLFNKSHLLSLWVALLSCALMVNILPWCKWLPPLLIKKKTILLNWYETFCLSFFKIWSITYKREIIFLEIKKILLWGGWFESMCICDLMLESNLKNFKKCGPSFADCVRLIDFLKFFLFFWVEEIEIIRFEKYLLYPVK